MGSAQAIRPALSSSKKDLKAMVEEIIFFQFGYNWIQF